MATQFKLAKTAYVDDLEDRLNDRIENLEENQYTGVIVYETYADLSGSSLSENVSYKVTNDSTLANNGYWHYNGVSLVKDINLDNSYKNVLGIFYDQSEISIEDIYINSIESDLLNITRLNSRTYPWLLANVPIYAFEYQYNSRYLVIGGDSTSVIAITIDGSVNSGRLFRWNNNDTNTLIYTLENHLITSGIIKAVRINNLIYIYVDGELKWEIDVDDYSDTEFDTPVFGNVFFANGDVLQYVSVSDDIEKLKTSIVDINDELTGYSLQNISNVSELTGVGLTINSVTDQIVNVTIARTYPWFYNTNDKYQYTLGSTSKYLVLCRTSTTVLTITIDGSVNSGRLFRWNTSNVFSIVDSLSNILINAGSTIRAENDGTYVKIYVNDILTWSINYTLRAEPEWNDIVFGNAVKASGDAVSGAKTYQNVSRLGTIESRLDILENGEPDTEALRGEVMATAGDSLEAQLGMQPIIVSRFGLDSYQNVGVSGKTIIYKDSSSVTEQLANITGSPALIYVGGGVNDFGKDSPLGNLASTDKTEFYGALNYICNYLITNFPNSLIIGSTIPFSDWQTPNGWANGQVNNIGLTREDYAFAQRQVYKLWGIPYIDQLSDLDWNLQNITDKLSDRLHPNATGSLDRANLLAKKINELYS